MMISSGHRLSGARMHKLIRSVVDKFLASTQLVVGSTPENEILKKNFSRLQKRFFRKLGGFSNE